MARRGENIYKRKDGRWEGRYICGRKPDGKAIYASVYSATYSDVKEKLQLNRNLSEHRVRSKCRLTVKELFTLWLEQERGKVKESSYARYVMIVEKHIIPCIGKEFVATLTANELSEFLELKEKSGRLNGSGGLSGKTVRDIAVVIKSVLKLAAMNYGYVSEADTVKLPQQKSRKANIFSESEISLLADIILSRPDISGMGVLLSLNTGLRIGELCALKWSDVDFRNGELCVSRAVQRISDSNWVNGARTKLIIQTPKSENSIRTVPLPLDMLALLKKLSAGAAPCDYIFTGKPNMPMDPRTYQYRFRSLLKRHDLKTRNFHALRHTYATRCIEKGIDAKSLSEMLGHSDIKTTLKLYVHSSMEYKKHAVQSLCFLGVSAKLKF